MKKSFIRPLLVWAFTIFSATIVTAQTSNPTINIQGTLKDASGKSVDNGNYQVTFRLYSAETGGSVVWQELAQVEANGGIYSYNLGSATPLTSTVFGSTVYMSLEFNGFELTPRTELTYAPYAFASTIAQTAACSGVPGDIKYSILNPTDFATVNGDCWVPMNGAALSSSSTLRMITGRTNVPDGSGLFIQGQEFSGGQNNDSGRTPSSPIATLQNDEVKNHIHNVASAGQHSHNFVEYLACCGSLSASEAVFEVGGSGGNDALEIIIDRLSVAGNHTHTINATGGNETRSKNLNLWSYICIK